MGSSKECAFLYRLKNRVSVFFPQSGLFGSSNAYQYESKLKCGVHRVCPAPENLRTGPCGGERRKARELGWRAAVIGAERVGNWGVRGRKRTLSRL